ncbi:MAG: undecaprenyl/decaprenyl-phosphate alpha-N-acetylglucosaminyl 1-phosphate transferase [Bacteroidales bacterium]|jgi:UDP-N-acetylmuramyl pentapeptide phosphotransferase/UDP-N-acetylglucosamine-1-phosphate transferase|nr:undecaprenyl/decaprenyl-phosphate alpha-N-acetylglucosaminyl 1-phosphate transferase [Bacteroidales bacterium]
MTDNIITFIFLSGNFIISLFLGAIIIPRILLVSRKKQLYDSVDARKQHTGKVPRLGGISFFPAILITMCFMIGLGCCLGLPVRPFPNNTKAEFLFLVCGTGILYLIGEMDDLIGVRYKIKFIFQIAAAVMMISSGVWIHDLNGLFGIHILPAWFGILFSIILIVFITNSINLIDGVDGLASGLCIIAFGILSLIYIHKSLFIYAMLAISAAGAIIPFWVYNVFGDQRKGHKLFMGDTGSLTLGLLLSFLAIKLCSIAPDSPAQSARNMIIAFSTLLVPMFDAIRVSIHRMLRKRNPFLPDRNHIHHLLIRTGMKIRYVMVTIILIDVSFVILNRILISFMNITFVICTDIILWMLLHEIIKKKVSLFEIKNGMAHDAAGNSFKVDDASMFGKEIENPDPERNEAEKQQTCS